MNNQTQFISTPLSTVLEEAAYALRSLDSSMSMYALCDYVFQSLFLKMTGFGEQKCKCICWDLASRDYVYRYEIYSSRSNKEFSQLKDKCCVWTDLLEQIHREKPNFHLDKCELDNIIVTVKGVIEAFYHDARLEGWSEHMYSNYLELMEYCDSNCVISAKGNSLLGGNKAIDLQTAYDMLYRFRNRCAHNTTSYQQNLPALETLRKEEHRYDNYFFRFALLLMIDMVITGTYKVYDELYRVNEL